MARDVATNLGGPLITNKWWLFGSWRLYDLKESVLSVRNQDGTPTVSVWSGPFLWGGCQSYVST
jgi:hypothetical protein